MVPKPAATAQIIYGKTLSFTTTIAAAAFAAVAGVGTAISVAASTACKMLLLRLRQQWRGWPLGEPACTCRRCCVKPLAERRWQSTHGRQALKKTAVPEPARELPLAKQARALRRPHAAGCPGRCAIAPAGWMANLWRGARGRGGTARHSTWSTSRGGSGKEILNARSSGTLP